MIITVTVAQALLFAVSLVALISLSAFVMLRRALRSSASSTHQSPTQMREAASALPANIRAEEREETSVTRSASTTAASTTAAKPTGATFTGTSSTGATLTAQLDKIDARLRDIQEHVDWLATDRMVEVASKVARTTPVDALLSKPPMQLAQKHPRRIHRQN